MKKMMKAVVATAVCAACGWTAMAAEASPRWKMFDRRLGVFVHWGVYSVGGWHEQEQMRRQVPRKDYEKYAQQFAGEKFDADAIVADARRAGADYLVFTSKHHDGFCMWDTKTTDYNSVKGAPAHRDFVKELADACRRGGLKFGLYYSNPDWHHPNAYNAKSTHQIEPEAGDRPDMDAYRAYVREQITELLTNYGEIACLFWDIPPKIDDPGMNALARRLQPNIWINDRGWTKGEYSTPERGLPSQRVFTNNVEACDSVGAQSWGYRANEDYHTANYLLRNIDQMLAMGGNFLLNVGPKADGTLPALARTRLAEVGDWMSRVGAAFRDVEAAPGLVADAGCYVTRRGGTVYLHYPNGLDANGLNLSPLDRLPKSAKVLNTGAALDCELVDLPSGFWKKETGKVLHVRDIPSAAAPGAGVVIELQFD